MRIVIQIRRIESPLPPPVCFSPPHSSIEQHPAEQCTYRLMAMLRRVQNEADIDIMYPLRIIEVRSNAPSTDHVGFTS